MGGVASIRKASSSTPQACREHGRAQWHCWRPSTGLRVSDDEVPPAEAPGAEAPRRSVSAQDLNVQPRQASTRPDPSYLTECNLFSPVGTMLIESPATDFTH